METQVNIYPHSLFVILFIYLRLKEGTEWPLMSLGRCNLRSKSTSMIYGFMAPRLFNIFSICVVKEGIDV